MWNFLTFYTHKIGVDLLKLMIDEGYKIENPPKGNSNVFNELIKISNIDTVDIYGHVFDSSNKAIAKEFSKRAGKIMKDCVF